MVLFFVGLWRSSREDLCLACYSFVQLTWDD